MTRTLYVIAGISRIFEYAHLYKPLSLIKSYFLDVFIIGERTIFCLKLFNGLALGNNRNHLHLRSKLLIYTGLRNGKWIFESHVARLLKINGWAGLDNLRGLFMYFTIVFLRQLFTHNLLIEMNLFSVNMLTYCYSHIIKFEFPTIHVHKKGRITELVSTEGFKLFHESASIFNVFLESIFLTLGW